MRPLIQMVHPYLPNSGALLIAKYGAIPELGSQLNLFGNM